MEPLVFLLPALICPIVMGGMMWFMMRARHDGAADVPSKEMQELARLRSEIDALREAPDRLGARAEARVGNDLRV